MAINCWVVPPVMLGAAGVTVMEVNVAVVTVKSVLPETIPKVAVIIAERPAAIPDARPPASIVAATVSSDTQATLADKSWVLESL